MIREDDLRETLNITARDMAELESNPRTWLSWMVYLLARLEEKTATSSADKDSYLDMLSALQDEIRNRVRTGGWN
jgi:replication-associated recombination protein RarA